MPLIYFWMVKLSIVLIIFLTLFYIFQLELISFSSPPTLQLPSTISSPQISFLLLTLHDYYCQKKKKKISKCER